MSTYLRLTVEVTDGDDLFVAALAGHKVTISTIGDEASARVLSVNYVAPESVED
jgi:hypothetical protein